MRVLRIATALVALFTSVACSPKDGGSDTASAASTGAVDLTGAGATFPYPLYYKWFSVYAAKTGVRINYQSIGSGGGIRQFSEQTVDFGATDAPMSDEEITRLRSGGVMHVPTVIGAVAVAYNVPGITQPLKLSGEVLGDIFLGKITKWNDARIAALNAGVTLPSTDILVVHRSDGSGTTYVFTDYLAAVSPAWKAGPGKGKEVQWPVGLGGKGNEGVAGQVKQTPGTLGYVELAYVKQNRLQAAEIRNAAGAFVAPSVDAATAAASGFAERLPPNTDYRVSIVNAPGADSYPISSFTWLLVNTQPADAAKSKKLHDFLRWALTEGAKEAAALDYGPLPKQMSEQLLVRLDSIAPRTSP
jgi:phosphate transport system substrate-binding protein